MSAMPSDWDLVSQQCIIENQNNNKQWNHMLNDLHKKKYDVSMLKLHFPYCLKKNCIDDNSQQFEIHELFEPYMTLILTQ